MKIVDYIKAKKATSAPGPILAVVCADGFTISCQASGGHYCTPREDSAEWTTIELGYPSALPPLKIRKYAEDRRDLHATVYGYVPVDLVDAMLKKHGGIKD